MNHKSVGAFLVLVIITAGIGPATAMGTAVPSAQTPSSAAVSMGSATAAQTAGQGNCSFPVTATDATGTTVTIEQEPEQVVAIGANIGQTLWEIGAKEKVIARSVVYTKYLNGSGNPTGVYRADGFTVAIERIVGLESDLVLAANIIPNSTIRKLRSAGLTVFKFESADSFADIYNQTHLIGRLVGACEGADRIVTAMQTRVSTIRQTVADESEPRVLYLLGSSGFVAGNGTFIGDVITTAGAQNLAANAGIEDYAQISAEVVASRNPQWIITSNRSYIPEGEAWASTTALQQNQVIIVNGNYISQPAPRVVFPLTKIAKTLHPDAIASANLSGTPIGLADLAENATTTPSGNATPTGTTTTATVTTATTGTTAATAATATTASDEGTPGATETAATATETTETTNGTAGGNETETSSSNGAGFGVAVAAIALLGAALLARRRT